MANPSVPAAARKRRQLKGTTNALVNLEQPREQSLGVCVEIAHSHRQNISHPCAGIMRLSGEVSFNREASRTQRRRDECRPPHLSFERAPGWEASLPG